MDGGNVVPELRIRQSEVRAFMRCRRKWLLTYRMNMQLARDPNSPTPNLSMGSIFHKAVELYWTEHVHPAQTVAKIQQDVIFATTGPLSEEWVKIFQKLTAMSNHYVAWVEEGNTMHEKVLFVEKAVECKYGTFNGYDVVLTGKLDRLVLDTFTDQKMLIDLKSTAQFMRGLTHHFQLLTYSVMLKRESNIKIERIVTEQVKKVLGTSTAKPPFVDRVEMFVNDEMIAAHERVLQRILQDMTALVAEYDEEHALYTGEDEHPSLYNPSFYPNPTSDCSWECDFLPVCCQMDDGSDFGYTLERSYRIRPKEDEFA